MEFVTALLLFNLWFLATRHVRWLLAPRPGVEPTPPALEGSLNHWTVREVPLMVFLHGLPEHLCLSVARLLIRQLKVPTQVSRESLTIPIILTPSVTWLLKSPTIPFY